MENTITYKTLCKNIDNGSMEVYSWETAPTRGDSYAIIIKWNAKGIGKKSLYLVTKMSGFMVDLFDTSKQGMTETDVQVLNAEAQAGWFA